MSKKAIIIGASSGIGNSLARIMSAKGYTLGLTGRRRNLLDELARGLPHPSFISDFDLADVEASMQSLKKLIEDMDGVDIIVVNAGFGKTNKDLHWETELLTIDVNVRGFSAVCNVAFDYFKKKGSGHLVGVSSMLALVGTGQSAAYSASKAYVSSYMDCLRRRANQLNLPMTLTDIKPGFVDTPMTKDNPQMFWVSSSDKAAGQICKAIERKREHAYITRRWTLIGWLMKALPSFVFAKF